MPNISSHTGQTESSIHTPAIAAVFAALGDDTRLAIVNKLQDGSDQSVSTLSQGFSLTRQGVSRHLDVLTHSGLIARHKVGRETRYRLKFDQLERAHTYLARASKQWDEAIARLASHVDVS